MTSNKKDKSIIPQDKFIHKEGFMVKKTGLLRLWRPRYFVLVDDLLCYYMKKGDEKRLAPAGRIFISDIEKLERAEKKSHVFGLQIDIKNKSHLMSCSTYEDREEWLNKIWQAQEKQKNLENEDPIRAKSTRLGKDYKRVTIQKDPKHGIGCTIKNVGGAIFVSRIIPDGPVATTGVLRPGDQIIDVNGSRVSECSIEKIKEIITSSTDHIICTVKPVTIYSAQTNAQPVNRTAYTEVDPNAIRETCESTETSPYAELNVSVSEEDITESYLSQDHVVDASSIHGSVESLNNSDTTPKKMTNYVELAFDKS